MADNNAESPKSNTESPKSNGGGHTEQNARRNRIAVLSMAFVATLSIVAVAGISFAVLRLYIQSPTIFGLADWLKAGVPVVGGAIVVIFAFLGVNRLKDFDERQDKLSKEIRDELTHRMDKSDSALSDVKSSADDYFQSLRSDITGSILPTQISNAIDQKNMDLQGAFDEKQNAVAALITEFQDKYKTLMALFDNIPALRDVLQNITDWSTIQTNVAWVHDFVQKQFANIGTAKSITETTAILENIKALVDAVCADDSKISGDADDYHNLSSELARNNQYDMAVDVLKKGKSLFRHNIDILAGIVLYSTRIGCPDVETENKLSGMPRKNWNWRTFTFYVDTLNSKEHSDDNKDAAIETADEYIKHLPHEERAYMAKYEVLKNYGLYEEGKNVLKQAEITLGMTAQCSLALCQIYKMEGEYELAIKSATKAVISTAETQPSAYIGAAVAERAFSRDALVQRDILNSSRSLEECKEDITLAIADYELAKKLRYRHGRTIDDRILILQSLVGAENGNSDVEEESRKSLLFKLLMLLNMDRKKLDTLLADLRELSPITEENNDEYLMLFLEAADGDAIKAKQIQEIVEDLFT